MRTFLPAFILPLALLTLCEPLHAETRSCHSEWLDGEVSTEVNVRVRLDQQMPVGYVIETFISWQQDEEGNRQVFSAYVNTDSLVDETLTIDDDHGARRFRLHPNNNAENGSTVVRFRRQGRDYIVDVDRVDHYHRGQAPFPRHAVIGFEGADCQVKMFDP